MACNPLEQRGLPLEEQFRSWNDLNVKPYDKDEVDPYIRTRVIRMNGVEVESSIFSHQFARSTDNPEIRNALAALTGKLPEGSLREAFPAAVDEVEAQEDEHLGWAKQTRQQLMLQLATR
ncbi:MAG: hypothetical protein ACRDV7_09135 [Acidimicrobiia bacterium]